MDRTITRELLERAGAQVRQSSIGADAQAHDRRNVLIAEAPYGRWVWSCANDYKPLFHLKAPTQPEQWRE